MKNRLTQNYVDILECLCRYKNVSKVQLTTKKLSEDSSVNVRTVRRIVDRLEGEKLIKVGTQTENGLSKKIITLIDLSRVEARRKELEDKRCTSHTHIEDGVNVG